MTRIILICFVLNAIGYACFGQAESRPAPDKNIVGLLTSPFVAERKLGIQTLKKAVSESMSAEFLDTWLEDKRELVRFGAACCAAETLDGKRATSKVLAVIKKEPLATRKEELGRLAFLAAFDAWNGKVDFFDGKEGIEALPTAALQFARKKLDELVAIAALTSDFGALGKFASLGPYALPALAKIAGDKNAGQGQRALAMSALARINSQSFWVTDSGTLTAKMTDLLDAAPENVKVNALFSMAYLGLTGPESIKAIKTFVMRDAYSAETIQGALYFLYTLPDAVAKREEQLLQEVAREYLDGSYSQIVRYNAALLLARINVAALAEQVCGMIREEPDFASYWALAALINRSADIPEPNRATLIDRINAWVLESKDAVPQLKALAVWYQLDQKKPLPEGMTPLATTKAVRTSIATNYTANEDPSHLSIRSGLDILAHLRDPKIIQPLRLALTHRSEAVRMAAGLAGGASGIKELDDDLYKASGNRNEFAAFGATWGLKDLGDARASTWFAHYLLNGNACLMPASLNGLRALTGKKVADSIPSNPEEWRIRGRAWCTLLQLK